MRQEEADFNFKLQLYKLYFIYNWNRGLISIDWLVDVFSHDSSKSIKFRINGLWTMDFDLNCSIDVYYSHCGFFKFPAESHTLHSSSKFIYLFAAWNIMRSVVRFRFKKQFKLDFPSNQKHFSHMSWRNIVESLFPIR